MIVEAWAEEFADPGLLSAESRHQTDLHLADTAAAFFAGCRSAEAKALAGFYDATRPGVTDFGRLAGAISAIIRRTECDDIHPASCMTPAAVAMSVALASANAAGADDGRFDRSVSAGYAVGLRLGAALGGPLGLASGIWPTFFAAPMMAAASASVCLGLDARGIAAAIALAAAGAGGRIGRAPGARSGRWLGLGEAVVKGCRAALAAAGGFQGDVSLISPEWLSAIAGSKNIDAGALSAYPMADAVGLVGLKPFVAARQTINAVVAFRKILQGGISPGSIERVEIGVPAGNLAMVNRPAEAGDRLSTISNIHVQIAASALCPAMLYDIEREGEPSTELQSFAKRVLVSADPSLESEYPALWGGSARVWAAGRCVAETCMTAPGDPGHEQAAALNDKLTHMVPPKYHRLCKAPIEAGEPARGCARSALWTAMRDALSMIG